ncbi:MAG: cell division protein ZapB [Clostridia bacterium]|jgi:chromosome segregation ATPase
MISLEQVRALEARVEKAVAFIASLRAENASLKDGLLEAELRTEAAEARTAELEGLIKEFQKDQERIEEGIVQALRKLDAFEDVVHAAAKPAATTSAPASVQPPVKAADEIPVAHETGTDSGEEPASIHAAAEDQESDQSDGLDIF